MSDSLAKRSSGFKSKIYYFSWNLKDFASFHFLIFALKENNCNCYNLIIFTGKIE